MFRNKNIFIRVFFSNLGSLILDIIDTILAGIGFILNAVSLIVFVKNGKGFGFPIK